MDKVFEQQYHELEKTQWWFTGRRHIIHRLVGTLQPGTQLLDIGCSGGLLLLELKDKNPGIILHGIDVSPEAIALCHSRGLGTTQLMDAQKPTLKQNHFDMVIASDCLEHIANDTEALRNWYQLMKPGAQLLVFVPAFMFLWGNHDTVNHHHRRYTARQLKKSLQQAGFTVTRTGYWNFTLFLPALLLRGGKKLLGLNNPEKANADNLLLPSNFVNRLLKTLLKIENKLIPAVRYPFGISTFCLAQKPADV